jgi:integrase
MSKKNVAKMLANLKQSAGKPIIFPVEETPMNTPPWTQTYLDSCARARIAPKTMKTYRFLVKSITNDYGLDLQTCSEEQLMATLDKIQARTKPNSYALYAGQTRRMLRFLDRDKLAKKIPRVRKPDRATEVKEKVLPAGDVERLIRGARNRVQRLIITLLYETGARPGEIANLSIRDLQFDEHSAILALTGKTGTRKRRVYLATPDLRGHINDHVKKDDPSAPLFLTQWGTRFGYSAIYELVRALGTKILKKRIYPYQLRHTKATLDSSHFTDRQMMELFGWRTPLMVSVYSHLTMRDVDAKDLALHGMKPREEILQPIVSVLRCPSCNEDNAAFSVYCVKCGHVLSSGNADLIAALQDGKFISSLAKNPQFIEALKKALTTA